MTTKWKTLLALIVIYLGVLAGWNWIWGVLFIMWTIPALYSGEIFLVETITRDKNPFLYWAIVVTWLWLSVYVIAVDLWSLYDSRPDHARTAC